MTYREHYETYIEPNLEAIDLFIKTDEPITSQKICQLLSITEIELFGLLKDHHISQLNKMTFFLIMKLGSSPICRMFHRELETGFPATYNSKDVSYIYNLPLTLVENAFSKINAEDVASPEMKNLFSFIPYPRKQTNTLRA